jgi:hypothetical protein
MSTDLGENSLAAVPENKKTMRRNDIAIRKGTKSLTPILMEQFTQSLSRIPISSDGVSCKVFGSEP